MRKITALIMAAILLLTVTASPAEEQEAADVMYGVFDLYDMNGETAVWTGVGIPVLPGLVILPEINMPENGEGLMLMDDSGMWEPEIIISIPGTHVAFISFDAETTIPKISPWPMMNVPGLPDPGQIYVYDTNASGDKLFRSVSAVTPLTWEGMDCMTLTLSGSVHPGAPVLTEGNELTGMILAECSEGVNRYIALTVTAIYSLVFRLSDAVGELSTDMAAPEGFTVTPEKNRVTFDWSKVSITPSEGMNLYLVVADAENDYINFGSADTGETSGTMLLTPGRTYLSGLLESATAPNELPKGLAVTELPEAEKLTAHGFKPVMTALVRSESGDPLADKSPEAFKTVTAEDLKNGYIFFYSHSSYDVTEEMQDTLLISMETPDGMDYRYVSGWIYSPSYEQEDIWATSMTDLGFARVIENKNYMAGEYRISYYVGGDLADSFTFAIQ